MTQAVRRATAFNLLDDIQRRLAALEGLSAPGGAATTGTPSVTLGTAASPGTSSDVLAVDATLPIFDTLPPSSSLPGDVAQEGAVAAAERRGHTHGREKGTSIFNILDFGAVGDCTFITDAAVSAGSNIITSPSGGFANAEPGMLIGIANAGSLTPTYTEYSTVIQSVQSATQVTAVANATTTVTSNPPFGVCGFGTDNLAAFNAAISVATGMAGAQVLVPGGAFACSAVILSGGASNFGVMGLGKGISAVYGFHQATKTQVLRFNGGSYVSCRNLQLCSFPVSARGPTGSVLQVQSQHFEIENVAVLPPPGMFAFSASEPTIVVSNLNTNTTPQAGPGLIRGCTTFNTLADGIFVANSDGVRIIGNRIESAGDDGISVHSQNPAGSTPQPTLQCTNTVVMGNSIDTTTSGGIACNGSDGLVINANVITNTWGAGLRLRANAFGSDGNHVYGNLANVTITGNVIKNAGRGATPAYLGSASQQSHPTGIQLSAYRDSGASPPISCTIEDVLIEGNSIIAPVGSYINVYQDGPTQAAAAIEGISIKSNHFNAVTDALDSRQDPPAGIDRSTVAQPFVGIGHEASHMPGIYLHYVTDFQVLGNFVHVANAHGIYVHSSCVAPGSVGNNLVLSSWASNWNNSGAPGGTISAICVPGALVGALITANRVSDPGNQIAHAIDCGTCTGLVAHTVYPTGKPLINVASITTSNNIAV